MKHSPAFLKLVEQTKQEIREVHIADVRKKLDAGEHVHFIDVREAHEFAQDHAKGAIDLGRGILERDIERLIPDNSAEIVMYCGSGFRSALAADTMQRQWYTNVT